MVHPLELVATMAEANGSGHPVTKSSRAPSAPCWRAQVPSRPVAKIITTVTINSNNNISIKVVLIVALVVTIKNKKETVTIVLCARKKWGGLLGFTSQQVPQQA